MSLLLEIVQAYLSSDGLKFPMLTFDNVGSRDQCQRFGLLECSLVIPKVLLNLLSLWRYRGLSGISRRSRKTFASQKYAHKLFSSEKDETGVKNSASLNALRGYQRFLSIPFHRGDMRVLVESPSETVGISSNLIGSNFGQ